jgi:hypothetical protein
MASLALAWVVLSVDAQFAVLAARNGQAPAADADPTISSVTPSSFEDTDTGIVVAGLDFGASETGSAEVTVCPTNDVADMDCETQDATAWGATEVTFTAAQGDLVAGSAFLFVTDSAGDSNASGEPVTFTEPGGGMTSAIIVEDWSDWRDANNGSNKFFRPYNGASGDAGPTQSSSGVNDNRLVISAPASNIWYVEASSPPYTDENDWLRNHIESGETWDEDVNRMSFGFVTTGVSPDGAPSHNFNWGTYEKEIDDFEHGVQGRHFYHGVGFPVTANKAVKIWLTNRPDHEVGDPGGQNYDPRDNYFHKLTRTYYTHWGDYYSGGSSSATYWMFPYFAWNQDDIVAEDDAFIGTAALQHDGTQYKLRFSSRKGVATVYDIRYTTDGDTVREKGFTSATSGGTATAPGDDYTTVVWDSGALAESADGFCVAARRQGQTTLFTEWCLPFQFDQDSVPFQ